MDFDDGFATRFDELLRWRRDVRRFRTDPVDPALLDEVIASAELSPSVGNSQPWRWVEVTSPDKRAAVRECFEKANREALDGYRGDRAQLYAGLKLSGLDDAPVQLAVFCEHDAEQGHGLGRQTMPETMQYSVVTAVSALWLAARVRGVGVGWVSIIDADEVAHRLEVPDTWKLVAYLCIGYPQEEATEPELQRLGWQDRTDTATRRFTR